MPESIASQLKETSKTIADGFQNATVLFADMVGFTQMASALPPAELVDILNKFFSAYDDLCDFHRIEKIKTIGDAYMAACGVPDVSEHHAQKMARYALDMLEITKSVSKEINVDIKVRIGISSGPVVAGVIGKKKYNYDLWGDTVNLSSRMESHGIPGKIQVSESSYQLLKNDFSLEEMPTQEIKGKGEMKTYLLIS